MRLGDATTGRPASGYRLRPTCHRDVFLFGVYTGMCRGEIMPLRWEDVDLDVGLFRVEETKTGVPLELPVTR